MTPEEIKAFMEDLPELKWGIEEGSKYISKLKALRESFSVIESQQKVLNMQDVGIRGLHEELKGYHSQIEAQANNITELQQAVVTIHACLLQTQKDRLIEPLKAIVTKARGAVK